MGDRIEKIKKLALKGIVASESLRETLILKGGNAIDLAHGLGVLVQREKEFSLCGVSG